MSCAGGKCRGPLPLDIRRSMTIWFSLLIGLWVVALLLSAGGVGYALARAPAWRRTILAICCGLTLVYGASGALFASGVYTRLTQPVLTTALQDQPPNAASHQLRPAADAWLRFQSDPGDFIGIGKNELWTESESNFAIRGDGHDIQVNVSGKGDWWDLEFRAPSNGALRVGKFIKAERAPFVTGKAPGLDIDGSGRGCNTLSGQFDVTSVRWTSSGEIVDIDVLFEQHCEGGTAALRGELWLTTEFGVHKVPPDMSTAITI